MKARTVVFLSFSSLCKSLYKRFYQAGYECSFLNNSSQGEFCELSNRSYFKFWNSEEDSNQELILVSDLHPKTVMTYLEQFFKNKKVILLDGYSSLKQPFFWRSTLVQSLKEKGIEIIKAFGNYSNDRFTDSDLYFHSETILCSNDSGLAVCIQKLLFSIGVKAFYAGPLANEKWLISLYTLEHAIDSNDQLHDKVFFKLLNG
jgi:hypothetical protein